MKKRKLIIYSYVGNKKKIGFFWCAATKTKELCMDIYDHISRENFITADEALEKYVISNYWIVENAVHKDEIKC